MNNPRLVTGGKICGGRPWVCQRYRNQNAIKIGYQEQYYMVNQDKYMPGIENAAFRSALPLTISLRKEWQKTPGKDKNEVKGGVWPCFFFRISDTLSIVPPIRVSYQYLNKRGVS